MQRCLFCVAIFHTRCERARFLHEKMAEHPFQRLHCGTIFIPPEETRQTFLFVSSFYLQNYVALDFPHHLCTLCWAALLHSMFIQIVFLSKHSSTQLIYSHNILFGFQLNQISLPKFDLLLTVYPIPLYTM